MKPFRFAIMGAGGIANKFCDAVRLIPDCEVCAISSKSMERAESFAARHNLPAAYDSYEEMLRRERPDCVYIAVTHDAHFTLCMLCLDYDTPVLCEKSMFQNSSAVQAYPAAYCRSVPADRSGFNPHSSHISSSRPRKESCRSIIMSA